MKPHDEEPVVAQCALWMGDEAEQVTVDDVERLTSPETKPDHAFWAWVVVSLIGIAVAVAVLL